MVFLELVMQDVAAPVEKAVATKLTLLDLTIKGG